jgi:hypothetical protein
MISQSAHTLVGDAGEGLPVPYRRTLAPAIQAFARSMPASLSASMPALAANAGSMARATPHPNPLMRRREDSDSSLVKAGIGGCSTSVRNFRAAAGGTRHATGKRGSFSARRHLPSWPVGRVDPRNQRHNFHTALPHASPPPKPHTTTVLPGPTRPACQASSSASGIDPLDVFP